MPGNPHPVVAPYEAHDDQAIIGYHKLHGRVIVADADDVRNTDFSGQFGGLYIRSRRVNYILDTESILPDDDENTIIDAAGNHFLKSSDLSAPTSVEYGDADVSAGAITISNDADVVLINVTSSVDVNIPAAAERGGRILEIKAVGSAGFTPVLDGSETIDGNAPAGYEVTNVNGYLRLVPRTGGYALIGSQL
jgi:hypothetical protein